MTSSTSRQSTTDRGEGGPQSQRYQDERALVDLTVNELQRDLQRVEDQARMAQQDAHQARNGAQQANQRAQQAQTDAGQIRMNARQLHLGASLVG